MKIGLIVPGFSANESDWCIPALLDLVRVLESRADIHVFPLRYPATRHPYEVYRARVHPQGGGTAGGARRGALLARTVAAIAAEHRRAPFDLLHAFWADEPGLVATAAGSLLHVPTIVSLAGGELVGFPDLGYGGQLHATNRWMTRLALRRATRVTVGSSYLAGLARPCVPQGRLTVLPLGVDPRLFHPAPADASLQFDRREVNLLNVASLVPIKRQADLLRAESRLMPQVPNLHLHLVGDGPLRGELHDMAEALGLAGHVSFHGAVPHDRLPGYYRASDLNVLASRHEAQGMVVAEAAACGVPTVGTRVGIVSDLAAATVPPDDPDALAEAIGPVARDADLRRDLGRQALRRFRASYTLEHSIDQLCALYAEAVAG